MKSAKTCAVIGAGIGGLAAAIRLAKAGFEVTVFETNNSAGGKMAELKADGYRFDLGPTVLTKPEYVDELFTLCGKQPKDYWKYTPIEPIFKYFFQGGSVIESSSNWEQFGKEIQEKTADSVEALSSFLKSAAAKHHLTDEVFLQRSLHKPKNYFNWSTLRGILNFGKVEAFRTMHSANQAHFKDQRLVDIFDRYASYNGSNPYLAPATLNVISHYEITLGTYFPEGGIYSIINALTKLAEEVGVEFRFNTPVKEITTSGNQAQSIKTEEDEIPFDLVVSNADVYNTYTKLMPQLSPPKRIIEQPRSSSVIVFYWGMDRTFPKLGLHNMFLSGESKQEYEHLFSRKELYEDPTIHLTVTSKMNANDAPNGHENWAALISVPHDTGQDWDALIDLSRKRVIGQLNAILGSSIKEHIRFEEVLDPRKVATNTGAAFGAVFGNASNSMFSAFLRHPNFSKKLDNLFFCGGTAHPGPGIPLCLLSAKIATDLIQERYTAV